jgi:hypothetical protein
LPFQTADGFPFGLPLSHLTLYVVPSGTVIPDLGHGDAMEGSIELSVASSVQPVVVVAVDRELESLAVVVMTVCGDLHHATSFRA